jgi:hypothetical protein
VGGGEGVFTHCINKITLEKEEDKLEKVGSPLTYP